MVVTRYDRVERDGGIVRVHQEDLCQALSVPPDRKYENEGGPGVERVAALLRDAMPARESGRAVRRFADALIWNWLIAGTDAHAKNYSLLLAGDQVRLAPLYDVASALPYPDLHVRRLRFAMKLGGDYRVELWHNPWPRAARDLRLDAEELSARVDDLAQRAPDAFADAARDPQVTALARPLPATLADLVADRAGRCRELLTRSARHDRCSSSPVRVDASRHSPRRSEHGRRRLGATMWSSAPKRAVTERAGTRLSPGQCWPPSRDAESFRGPVCRPARRGRRHEAGALGRTDYGVVVDSVNVSVLA